MAVSTSPIANAESRVGSSALNHTVAFDCGSGADFLIAFFRVPTDGTDVTVVKYAGVDMTHLATINGLECWYLAAPSSGSNNVTWTTGISERPYYAFSSWSGVDGTTPVGTQATNNGNGNSLSTGSVTCPAGGVIVGCAHHDFANTFTASTGTLIGQYSQNGASQGRRIVHSVLTSTDSVNWTTTSSAYDWEAVGVPINAAGGGGGSAIAVISNYYRMMRSA